MNPPKVTTPDQGRRRLPRRLVLAGGAAGVAVAVGAAASSTRRRSTPRRALVIGAGMAGLAAAQELARAGVEVSVIEARDRIGGRIHTARLPSGEIIDLGATWIHGPRGNPITGLARAAGAQMVATSYDRFSFVRAPHLGTGRYDYRRWQRLLDGSLRAAGDRPHDISIRTAMDRHIDLDALSRQERADLGFTASDSYEQEWGASLADLSAWTVDGGKEFGGDDVLFPNGYSQVVDHVAAAMQIRTATAATAVRLRAHDIEVTTSTGVIEVDAVVVTVPLALLKAGTIAFEPPLPEPHRDAIRSLKVGILSKTFLAFDKPFWDTDADWLGYADPVPGSWPSWLAVSRGDTHLLVGFNAGDRARRLESMSNSAILASAQHALRAFGGSPAPKPRSTATTRWSRDPWARGSYSYPAVGTTDGSRRDLAEPIQQRLVFAGEACEPSYHSTVHGAYLSGIRAARQVAHA